MSLSITSSSYRANFDPQALMSARGPRGGGPEKDLSDLEGALKSGDSSKASSILDEMKNKMAKMKSMRPSSDSGSGSSDPFQSAMDKISKSISSGDTSGALEQLKSFKSEMEKNKPSGNFQMPQQGSNNQKLLEMFGSKSTFVTYA